MSKKWKFALRLIATIALAIATSGCVNDDSSSASQTKTVTVAQPAVTITVTPRPVATTTKPPAASVSPTTTPYVPVPISAHYSGDIGRCTYGVITVYANEPMTVNGVTISIEEDGESRFYLSFNDNGRPIPFKFDGVVMLQNTPVDGNPRGYILDNIRSSDIRGIQSYEIRTFLITASASYKIAAINLCMSPQ